MPSDLEEVTAAEKPRARWADPVWVSDTTYRLVNTGNAPAFDVVVKSHGEHHPWPGMPATRVPETHIAMVPPGASVNILVEVEGNDLPERPQGLSPRTAGWPPVALQIAFGWNDKKRWKPGPDDDDLLGVLEFFGFERANCSTKSLPLNKLPDRISRVRSRNTPRAAQNALTQFVQFERALNVWL